LMETAADEAPASWFCPRFGIRGHPSFDSIVTEVFDEPPPCVPTTR